MTFKPTIIFHTQMSLELAHEKKYLCQNNRRKIKKLSRDIEHILFPKRSDVMLSLAFKLRI